MQFLWWSQPVADSKRCPRRLLLDTVQVREVDHTLLPIPDSHFTIACDLVVPAIGQSPITDLMRDCCKVEVREGHIVTDRATGQTRNPRYFAGGDCVNGGREVVDAVADGKRSALAMIQLAEAAYA